MPKRRVSGKPISEQSVETFGAGRAGAHLPSHGAVEATSHHPSSSIATGTSQVYNKPASAEHCRPRQLLCASEYVFHTNQD